MGVMKMLVAFLLRLGSAVITIFGVVCMVFFLVHIVPGDPVEMLFGETTYFADREQIRVAMGLDQPLLTQLMDYLGGIVRFDLGSSLFEHRPVIDMLIERIPQTLWLTCVALLISIAIAIPLGILAAVYHNHSIDRWAMTFSVLGNAIPNFWLGPMLILVFSIWLGWLPVSGDDRLISVLLPAITLGSSLAAVLARMIRSSLLEVFNEDYIRTAYAKGLPNHHVILYHALRNALLPVITLLGLHLGLLLGGSIITETIFSWPGIGKLTVDAILKRDYPVVQGCILLISISYVMINMLTDAVYSWIDPRIRTQRAQ